MSKLLLYIFSIILLFSLSINTSSAQDKKNITIGVLHDGLGEASDIMLENLNRELLALLGSKYNIQIPLNKILDAKWSSENAAEHFNQLNQNPEVDLILGFGVLSSSVIVQEKTYSKPAIILGIINPESLNKPSFSQNFSGIENFSYVLFNQSVVRDIDTFYGIYPYQKYWYRFL
jgi:ABC-type uncharacterized transport system substrate-binding protein